jgi:hypothetical protein
MSTATGEAKEARDERVRFTVHDVTRGLNGIATAATEPARAHVRAWELSASRNRAIRDRVPDGGDKDRRMNTVSVRNTLNPAGADDA